MPDRHEAAAIITYLSPGLRFFHQGQFEGRRKRISPHLVRAPQEPVDERMQGFYENLMAVLRQPVFRDGTWSLLEREAGMGGQLDLGIASLRGPGSGMTANGDSLSSTTPATRASATCESRLPTSPAARCGSTDMMGPASFDRDGNELVSRGLYLDLPAWGYHVFEMTAS